MHSAIVKNLVILHNINKKRQCFSRCHKIDTFNCKNKSPETNGIEDYEVTGNVLSVSPAMPAFGVEIKLSDGNVVKFLNTCVKVILE